MTDEWLWSIGRMMMTLRKRQRLGAGGCGEQPCANATSSNTHPAWQTYRLGDLKSLFPDENSYYVLVISALYLLCCEVFSLFFRSVCTFS
jgi:hypothetical protein